MNREGYILTNNHVVEDADQIKVKLATGKEYEGKVVGLDPKTDLALIKINGSSDLQPLTLGNSDHLKVGSWVVAVGSPFDCRDVDDDIGQHAMGMYVCELRYPCSPRAGALGNLGVGEPIIKPGLSV